LENKIKELKDSDKNLEIKLKLQESILQEIDKYKEYQETIKQYNSLESKVSVLEKEELECKNQYAAAILLKEKILEAESIATINIISSINTHTQAFLEAFFPDNPISVILVPFKETKNGKKPQINIEIDYKGEEADIGTLSGGELSRVILAFGLALGEMFNTPLMMLDECTSSLDEDLTNDVMDGIRELFTGKLVLIIAHQITEGGFDRVIKM
jgi:DNA repair exonuclease SbcCD ATPase subunit